jgi:putative transposase
VKYACIRENEAEFDVRMMCSLFSVSRSGFYAWKNRPPCARTQRHEEIIDKMRAIHEQSRQTYGSPRMSARLRKDGIRITRKCTARLMKQAGIVVKIRRRFKATTNSKHAFPVAPNILDRQFSPKEIGAPNRCWAGDITYIDTMEGWLYLATVEDLFSRRIVGWSMSHSMQSTLVTDALTMAFERCGPQSGVLYHSDRGSQYAGHESRDLLTKYRMTCSMSRKGNCWDNAVVESFNGTLKTELIHRRRWTTREEARAAVYEYIEVWYNRQRLHSTLGYRSPEEYERLHAAGLLPLGQESTDGAASGGDDHPGEDTNGGSDCCD